jgi:predicted tellurium resistance membrane protein TerC
MNQSFSARDLILGAGGLFLIGKSTTEMVNELEDEDASLKKEHGKMLSMRTAIFQIVMIDIVFSFDSILTAVGLTDLIVIMIAAVCIAMLIMMVFSGAISSFMKKHPSMEVLALGFLILIGFMLMLEAFHYVIPKGYIYFAVAFSMLIEMTNIRVRRKRQEQRMKNTISIKKSAPLNNSYKELVKQ